MLSLIVVLIAMASILGVNNRKGGKAVRTILCTFVALVFLLVFASSAGSQHVRTMGGGQSPAAESQ